MAVNHDSWYALKEAERYARKDVGSKQELGPSQRSGLYDDPGLSKSTGLKRSSGHDPLPEDPYDKRRRLDNYDAYGGGSHFNDKNLPPYPPTLRPDDYRRESGINIRREDYRPDDFRASLSNLDPKMGKMVNPKFEDPFFNEGHPLPRGRERVSPHRSGEISRRPGEVPLRSEEILRRPEEISCRPGEVPRRPEEILRRPGEVPRRPDEIPHRPEEMSRRPEEILRRPGEVLRRPDEIPHRPEEMSRRPEEILRQPGEVPRRPNEIPYRPEEMSRRPVEVHHRPEEVPLRSAEMRRINYSQSKDLDMKNRERFARDDYIPNKTFDVNRFGHVPSQDLRMDRDPHYASRDDPDYSQRGINTAHPSRGGNYLSPSREFKQQDDSDLLRNYRAPNVLRDRYAEPVSRTGRDVLPRSIVPTMEGKGKRERFNEPVPRTDRGVFSQNLVPALGEKEKRDQYNDSGLRAGRDVLSQLVIPAWEEKEKREQFTQPVSRTGRDIPSRNVVPALGEKEKRNWFNEPGSRDGRDVFSQNIAPTLEEKEKREHFTQPLSRTGRDVLSRNVMPALGEKDKRDRYNEPIPRTDRDVLSRNVISAFEEKEKGRYVPPAMLAMFDVKQADEHRRSKKIDDPIEYNRLRGYNSQKDRIEPPPDFKKSVFPDVNVNLEKNLGTKLSSVGTDAYIGRNAPIPEPPAPPVIHDSFAFDPVFPKQNMQPLDDVRQRDDYDKLRKKNLEPDMYKESPREGRIEHIYRGNITDDFSRPKSFSKPDDYRRDDIDPFPRKFDRDLDSFPSRRDHDMPAYQHPRRDDIIRFKEFGPEISKESLRRDDYEDFRKNFGSDLVRGEIEQDDYDKFRSGIDVGIFRGGERGMEYDRERGFADREYYSALEREREHYGRFLDDRSRRLEEYERLGIDQGHRSPGRDDYYRFKGYSELDERMGRRNIDDLVREYAEYYRERYGIDDYDRIRDYIIESLHDRPSLESDKYLSSQLDDPFVRHNLGDYPLDRELDDRFRSDGRYNADFIHPDDFRHYRPDSNERRSDRFPPHSAVDARRDGRGLPQNNAHHGRARSNTRKRNDVEVKRPITPLMEKEIKPPFIKPELKDNPKNRNVGKNKEPSVKVEGKPKPQTSSSNEKTKVSQNKDNNNKTTPKGNESITINTIKSIDGPCGKNFLVVSKLNESSLQTLERTFTQMNLKYTFENKYDLQFKKWFAKVVSNDVELASESAYMKDTARNAACLLAIQKLRNHYYTVLIKSDYYCGGKELDIFGNMVPILKQRVLPKRGVFYNYDMPKVKKAINDYVNSKTVYDLSCCNLFDHDSCQEIKSYATSLKLQVRKFGPAKFSFLVISKQIDIWTIVEGLIKKDINFLANYQLLNPGSEIV